MRTSASPDMTSGRADVPKLRVEVYDALARSKGYETVTAQAALHGMARETLHDLKAGRTAPMLATAMRIAADLDTSVEALFGYREAA